MINQTKILMTLIILCVFAFSCGRIDKQYTKVVSPTEVIDTQVYCVTFLGIPTLCSIQTERRIKVVEIVEKVVEQIVVETKIVEVEIEKIVKEIETIYVDNEPVDMSEIVREVIKEVKENVPEEDIIYYGEIETLVQEIVEEVISEPVVDKKDTMATVKDEEKIPPTVQLPGNNDPVVDVSIEPTPVSVIPPVEEPVVVDPAPSVVPTSPVTQPIVEADNTPPDNTPPDNTPPDNTPPPPPSMKDTPRDTLDTGEENGNEDDGSNKNDGSDDGDEVMYEKHEHPDGYATEVHTHTWGHTHHNRFGEKVEHTHRITHRHTVADAIEKNHKSVINQEHEVIHDNQEHPDDELEDPGVDE